MLKNLSIKNIKSFYKEANLKIAPLTLIYGANSAGKSSLWKFLITLSRSLRRGSGKNFINFSRTFDFANSATISFDPNETSSFSFAFDHLNYSELQNDEDKKEGLRFEFTFINTTVDPGLEELELIGGVEKLFKEQETFSTDEKNKLLSDINKIKKAAEKIKNVNKVKSTSKDKGVFLDTFNIFKDNKIFAKYKIVKLKHPLISMVERVKGGTALKAAKNVNLNAQMHEEEIAAILESFFKGKFKYQVGFETSKELWNEEQDGPYKNQIVRYDFVGPNGPLDIKVSSRDYDRINYLFLPIEISHDTFFWKEHYDFLQYLKKLIKKNETDKKKGILFGDQIKSDKELFKSYFEENYRNELTYYSLKGIDASKQIPEVQKNFDNILKVMMTNSIEEFSKIMSEDLKYFILRSSSFIPNRKLYGGNVYTEIFDILCTKFVDANIEKDQENDDANEFFKRYSLFNKFSIDDQIRNLFRFERRELKNFTENSFSSYSRNNVPSAVINTILHENEDRKKKIVELLQRIGLPFDISTQEDEKGNVISGFSNKNISRSQKNIPIEQSGNAIQSIIDIFIDLIRSENSTIIIEEPENKIHPKIQGNLIEIVSEIVDFRDSNKVIIETHSEHFILRIQKLIREGKLTPNQVAINYVYLDENGEGSKIDHMKLDNNGKFFSKWRHGFFNERLKEI